MLAENKVDYSIPYGENCKWITLIAYHNMIARCKSDSPKSKPYYKDKGIKIDPRWLESYDNFIADVGICPDPAFTLDRIDPDGDYTAENCRWCSLFVQMWNRGYKGTRGVSFYKQGNKWRASVKVANKTFHLGYYDDKDDALRIRGYITNIIDHLIDVGIIR